MGKAYLQSLGSPSIHDVEDDGWDNEISAETESLLEENAWLRALVVQLSTLVLKNVVEPK